MIKIKAVCSVLLALLLFCSALPGGADEAELPELIPFAEYFSRDAEQLNALPFLRYYGEEAMEGEAGELEWLLYGYVAVLTGLGEAAEPTGRLVFTGADGGEVFTLNEYGDWLLGPDGELLACVGADWQANTVIWINETERTFFKREEQPLFCDEAGRFIIETEPSRDPAFAGILYDRLMLGAEKEYRTETGDSGAESSLCRFIFTPLRTGETDVTVTRDRSDYFAGDRIESWHLLIGEDLRCRVLYVTGGTADEDFYYNDSEDPVTALIGY